MARDFPRNDLEASIEVARVIQDRGGGQVDSAQLAKLLGYSNSKSGTFSNRLAAARMFGLVVGQSPNIRPTPLAQKILNPVREEDEIEARVDSFLSVPLYRRVFERFQDQDLPPSAGLDNALKTQFGIKPSQAASARAKLLKCAQQAGLFSVDSRQMIRPLKKSSAPKVDSEIPSPQPEPVQQGSSPSMPKSVVGALESVPWNTDLSDTEIQQVIELISTAMRLHFMFQKKKS